MEGWAPNVAETGMESQVPHLIRPTKSPAAAAQPPQGPRPSPFSAQTRALREVSDPGAVIGAARAPNKTILEEMNGPNPLKIGAQN